ncbi:MAG: N-acetyl-gamma-glutamyl-phosphate reductase [Candidatus Margulisiibacteriota bacterium]
MINIAIVGATGFSGQELQQILEKHPKVTIKYTSGREWQTVGDDIDLAFLALPHGAAVDIAPHFLAKNIKVIDLSTDFRYKTDDLLVKIQETVPGFDHEQWEYSLPEMHRKQFDYSSIMLIANPGCYPTASLLGLAPLVTETMHPKPSIIIDAKSGYSGAGKKFIESGQLEKLKDNMWAYRVAGEHNHNREIEVYLGDVPVSFSPHIMPFYRGIQSTIYVDIKDADQQSLYAQYKKYYAGEPFVEIVNDLPTVKDVAETNECHIALRYDNHVQRLVIISVIDNLIKGAAGQAVQNMNLLFGIDETIALRGG